MNVLTAALALLSGAWVSPELALSPTTREPSYNMPLFDYAYAAAGGGGALVVFEDERPGGGVYAARVDASGALLDPAGLRVSATGHGPSVAFDGTNYLVAFESGTGGDIQAVRVSAAGAVLDGTPITVANLTGSVESPTVSWDGSFFVVAFGKTYGSNVYAVRVSSGGVVEDTTPKTVGYSNTDALSRRPAAVASIPGTTLIAWGEETSGGCALYGRRMASNGTFVDSAAVALGTGGSFSDLCDPFVAADGTGFAVAWAGELPAAAVTTVNLTRIGATGAPITAIPVSAARGYHPAVAYVGGSWVVVWDSSSVVRAARVSSTGAVGDTTAVPLTTTGRDNRATVTAFGSDLLVTFTRRAHSGGYTPVALRASVSSTAAPSARSETYVSLVAPEQRPVQLASSGAQALAVWVQDADDTARKRVMGTIVGRDGVPLSSPFEVGLGAANPYRVAATFDGTDYVVAWDDSSVDGGFDIYALRVGVDGGQRDAAKIPLATGAPDQSYPRISGGPGDTLVCWSRGSVLECARLLRAGTATSASIGINTSGSYGALFDVAWDGAKWLLVWVDAANIPHVLRAQKVSAQGALLGSPGVVGPYVGAALEAVHAGGGPEGFAVAYVDEEDIRVVALDRDGGVATTGVHPLMTRAAQRLGLQSPVEVLWRDGWTFVWQEPRSGTGADVLLRRMTDGGSWSDAQALIIAGATTEESGPSAAFLGGALAVSYAHGDPAPSFQSDRARLRLFSDLGAPGDVCQSGDQCGSGACVGFICCTTFCSASCTGGVCSIPDAGVVQDGGVSVDGGAPDAGATDAGGTATGDGGVTPALAFTSVAPSDARCGEPWSYAPAVSGASSFVLSTTKAPAGMTVSGGAVSWTPGADQGGSHDVELLASTQGGFASQAFTVTVDCPAPEIAPQGCGCTGAPTALAPGVLVLLLALLRRASRRRETRP